MKKLGMIVGLAALAAVVGLSDAHAQGRGGGQAGGMAPGGAGMGSNRGGALTGLNRADQVAGTHGAQGRAMARTKQKLHKRH